MTRGLTFPPNRSIITFLLNSTVLSVGWLVGWLVGTGGERFLPGTSHRFHWSTRHPPCRRRYARTQSPTLPSIPSPNLYVTYTLTAQPPLYDMYSQKVASYLPCILRTPCDLIRIEQFNTVYSTYSIYSIDSIHSICSIYSIYILYILYILNVYYPPTFFCVHDGVWTSLTGSAATIGSVE